MTLTSPKPVLVIVDGSVAMTGALVAISRQAQLLADQVTTILVLPRGHQVPAERLDAFADVIELPIVPLRKTIASLISYLPAMVVSSMRLRRELRRLGATRLQLNDFYLLHGTMLRLMGFRGRIATVVRIDPTRFGLVGRIWLTAARWSSDEIVAVSRFIQAILEPSPSRLIYGQASIVERLATLGPMKTPTFLYVANYIEGKGQEDAIEAFQRIADHYPTARLRFVGGDMGMEKNRQFRARLEQAAATGPGAARIEFRGSSNDLRGDYREAFAVLNFSASESFSNTCLDGSSAGLAVIATRCGGPEEIIQPGVSGFLVPVGDVKAMSNRMAWLLDHPAGAMAMGAAGSALVGRLFSPRRARIQFSELFDLQPPPS